MGEWQPHVVAVEGRFVAASNATLLGMTDGGVRVVYKPTAGEAPLWDFATETLARREVLTYEVSEALGAGVVPETVLGEGPFGLGSIQRFVDVDPDFDPVALVRAGDEKLWDIALLDLVCNNADRKLGHILRSRAGALVAIDHGLTFHPEDKLRTVLWRFAGEALPRRQQECLMEFEARGIGVVAAHIREALGAPEADAFEARVRTLTTEPRHPMPPDDRPALPWPPY